MLGGWTPFRSPRPDGSWSGELFFGVASGLVERDTFSRDAGLNGGGLSDSELKSLKNCGALNGRGILARPLVGILEASAPSRIPGRCSLSSFINQKSPFPIVRHELNNRPSGRGFKDHIFLRRIVHYTDHG